VPHATAELCEAVAVLSAAHESDSSEAQSPNDGEPIEETLQESSGADDSAVEATDSEESPDYVDPSEVSEADFETPAPAPDDEDEPKIHYKDTFF
jgi:hypothetical protein